MIMSMAQRRAPLNPPMLTKIILLVLLRNLSVLQTVAWHGLLKAGMVAEPEQQLLFFILPARKQPDFKDAVPATERGLCFTKLS